MKIDFQGQLNKKLILNEKTKTHFIDLKEIFYLKCDGYITTFHLADGKKIVISKLMKIFEAELSSVCFLRINRNTIVNLGYTKQISLKPTPHLKLINGSSFSISRRRIKMAKESLTQLIQ